MNVVIQIKSNQIYFAQNTTHLNAASGKSSWWAGSTKLKRALTVTLKRQVKQILSTNNGIAFKHKALSFVNFTKSKKFILMIGVNVWTITQGSFISHEQLFRVGLALYCNF